MTTAHILVVDDEASHRESLERMLVRAGHRVAVAADGDVAIAALQREPFDVVLSDLIMPRTDGMALLRASRRLRPSTHVVLMTAYGTVENAVAAMRGGAADFVTKPARRAELLACMDRLLTMDDGAAGHAAVTAVGMEGHSTVGATAAVHEVMTRGLELLRSGAPVVVCGEPGVGKRHAALSWHHAMAKDEPVYEVSARTQWSDIPTAVGTVMIRHVEELNDHCRQGLLAELKTRRAGGRRLIATSRLPARALTAAGNLSGELGQRLAMFALELPPLRLREGDIGLLAAHFAAVVCHRYQRAPLQIDDDAMACLSTWTYPDNVRELELAMERGVLWSKGASLRAQDLPDALRQPPPPLVTFRIGEMALEGFERKAIEATLQHAQGDKVLAAKLLGMSLRTLYRRLDRQDADDEGEAQR